MSKRTIALILFLFLITAILVAKALAPAKPIVTPPVATQPTPTPIIGHTKLTFSPNPVFAQSGAGSVDVNVDSGGDKLTGVQLEMKYNPQDLVITKSDLSLGNYFENPMVLRNLVDDKNGTISYLIVIPLTGQAKSGVGNVAKINFRAKSSAVAKETSIRLMPRSLATAEGIEPSVLIETDEVKVVIPGTQGATNPATGSSTLPQ